MGEVLMVVDHDNNFISIYVREDHKAEPHDSHSSSGAME